MKRAEGSACDRYSQSKQTVSQQQRALHSDETPAQPEFLGPLSLKAEPVTSKD
jgi:hypothetical protein